MLRGVLFDLWETLIYDRPERSQPRRAWRTAAVEAVLRENGFEAAAAEISPVLDAASSALTQLHDQGRDLDAIGRSHLFLDLLDAATGRRAPRQAANALLDVIAAMPLDLAPRPAPDALAVLRGLKAAGLAIGLVSNAGFTTAPNLRRLLDHYDLLQSFDVLVFSDEHRVAKPNARIFQAALDGLGLAASEAAFVGDSPYNDIAGATSAGLFAVQVGSKARDGIQPRARIQDLAELIPTLRDHALLPA